MRLSAQIGGAVLGGFLLWGCGPGKPLPYPTWVETKSTNKPELVALGERAEASARDFAGRLRLSATDLDRLEVACSSELAQLKQVLSRPMEYQPREPFAPDPARTGWQLMGTAVGHRLERQLWQHDDLGAVETYLLGEQLGFAIAGGDASDVALGFPMVDQLRATLASHLFDLSVPALQKLQEGVQFGLETFPAGRQNADNERTMMLSEVQAIQDAYRDAKFDSIESDLEPMGSDLLTTLKTLRERDDGRRVEFFEHLAAACDAEYDWLRQASRLPAVKREKEPIFKASARRPWQELAHFLFGSGGVLLRQRDLTLARTRLLYLQLVNLVALKTTGSPLQKLPTHFAALVQDPYSGELLHFSAKGKSPLIYSVGADGLDNGGDTDAALMQPDLFLESSPH